MIKHIKDDLFSSKESLAHAVSSDFKMGAGIAKTFRKKYAYQIFNALNTTSAPRGVGKCFTVKVSDRYIFNLITKKYYYNKPTLESMENALIDMFEQAVHLDVKIVAMPRVGCGLDRLKWNSVEKLIELYQETVDVDVYSL